MLPDGEGRNTICRISSGMSVSPSERLRVSREELQREFDRHQAAAGEPIGYGSETARWLAAQLPGTDPRQLGWGILAVTAMLLPAADEDGTRGGPEDRGAERTSMILASRVGEALVESAAPAVGRPPGAAAVGPELAACEMSAVYAEFAGRPAGSAAVDPAELRREFHESMADGLAEIRGLLLDELPGADLEAIGWALIGTGMSLLVQTSKIAPRSRWLRRRPRRGASARTSAMRSSLLLAAVGDYLAGQATQMDRSAR
jgi:hypothetical protein